MDFLKEKILLSYPHVFAEDGPDSNWKATQI